MSDPVAGNPVSAAIARRARLAVAARFATDAGGTRDDAATADPTPAPGGTPFDPALLESLRHHLLAGETHYPERPGMSDLRERIGARLPAIGYTARKANGVLVTASEGESLLVTLLGLGLVPGGLLLAERGGRHQPLLDWLGVDCAPDPRTEAAAGATRYREVGSLAGPAPAPSHGGSGSMIEATGGLLFEDHPSETARKEASNEDRDPIVIGDLSGLRRLGPFRLGFVAADPDMLTKITKWKQASSICSPAPSQRAALWALGVQP